ncbi:hypothetical protein EDB83DRAFT_2316721 [Lactarius deliciosus]|nr:hypothetical protein EDB83DRAFT_2316721 [Lactarius deliciosus]
MASQGSIPDKELLPQTVSNAPPLTSRDRFWQRLSGRTRRKVGWWESARAIFFVSWINLWLIFIPFAWASHFSGWGHGTTFALCFLAIVPLEKLFDWGGEQMAMYLGKDLGDLVVVTLNNAVEATLAIILLFRCELKLLQSTIAVPHIELIYPGVVLLHLLLIPGVAFFTGGARIWEQAAAPSPVSVESHAPYGRLPDTNNNNGSENATAITDKVRDDFLRISRGFAVILLVIYVGSRFYLHDPPGANNAFTPHPDIPEEVAAHGAGTSKRQSRRWFGIILLPIVSFSADATVAITFFIRQSLKAFIRNTAQPPESLAQARAIDMSIQFLLFWMPFLTLLGWWTNKPMSMLFDLFEVTLLVGACFLVNYVTADAKTNWAEGTILIAFYCHDWTLGVVLYRSK